MKRKGDEEPTYDAVIKCNNCGEEFELGVPFGVTIKEFKETIGKCTHCGCDMYAQ